MKVKFSKNYFMREVKNICGTKNSNVFLSVVNIKIKDNERLTWDEFFGRFNEYVR